MKGVMLTVQKQNKGALDFYLNKMKYIVDPISPSKSHPLAQPEDYDYEILSKVRSFLRCQKRVAKVCAALLNCSGKSDLFVGLQLA